ncbi:helix-turn-helix transcriptional regulator [Exiguobacterium sp. TBG-PICH-001]|uniref:helix-turn-helix domain-containing protein n=1 Tax=Exiguobacterium abrahamii TaxID=2785532 RepID=UPI0018A6D987|nr:helix-turn-helix domain-containing protein [Exiguobacterium sp. TBG-PICH-001]MBF8152697.1 helix-turn-helix transcriptional regulator [Exiguobacterium sp. TBG-PICH-001]
MDDLTSSIGAKIKQLRIEKQLTQQALCEGICSQAEISKIENGLNSPTVELLQKIAARLNSPIALLFENPQANEEIDFFDKFISDQLREENFDQVIQFISKYDHKENMNLIILSAYFKIIVEMKQNRFDFRTATSLLSNLLNEYDVWNESISLFIRIKTAIANIYAEHELYHLTTGTYSDIETLLEQLKSSQYITSLIKIYFNHAQILLYQDLFEEANVFIQKGINLCLDSQQTFLLGHFYFQLGNYQEAVGNALFQKTYTIAYTLLHAFEFQTTKQLVVDLKKEHLLFTFEYTFKHEA